MIWLWHSLSVEPLLGAASCWLRILRRKSELSAIFYSWSLYPEEGAWLRDRFWWLWVVLPPVLPSCFQPKTGSSSFPSGVTVKQHSVRHNFQFYQKGEIKHIWWLLYLSCWRALKMPYICQTLKKLVPQNDCDPRDCFFSQGQESKQVPPSFCINASQRAFPLTKGDKLEFNSMGQSGRTLKFYFFTFLI